MKRASLLLFLTLGFASWSFAGRIIGSITEAGKPIAKGVKIDIACGAANHAAETDAYGAFAVVVPEQGKCTLKVNYQGQAPTFDINSYEGSVQYDLVLEKQDGKYALKRK
jgi:hypothetical protein